MSEQTTAQTATDGNDAFELCQYPVGTHEADICGGHIPRTGKRGHPKQHCEKTDADGRSHTAKEAFKRRLQLRGAAAGVQPDQVVIPKSPVSDVPLNLSTLLVQLDAELGRHRDTYSAEFARLDGLLAEVRTAVATTTDPEAYAHEIDELRAEKDAAVGAARQSEAQMGRKLRKAEDDLAKERNLREEAQEAGKQLLADAEKLGGEMGTLRTETERQLREKDEATARTVEELQGKLRDAEEAKLAAEKALEEKVAETAKTVAAVRAEAEEHKRASDTERDSAVATYKAEKDGEVERIRGEADTRVRAAEQAAEGHKTAAAGADAAREAAEGRATTAEATAAELRERIETLRTESQEKLESLRKERDSREDQLRKEHLAELDRRDRAFAAERKSLGDGAAAERAKDAERHAAQMATFLARFGPSARPTASDTEPGASAANEAPEAKAEG